MCGMYMAGSCFDPATAAFLAVAAATASTTTTTVPCPWAHSLVCVRCRTCWARKTRKSWKKYRRATKQTNNNVSTGGGRMVQCATCAVWQEYATEFYKKDKRQYESTGKITCGTCRRLQCKSKLTGLPPPPAMATRGLPPSAAGATPVARETSPYYAYAPPAYYSGAVGPQRTQTQNTPSPFLGHHPEHTNNYYYHYQHPPPQPQSLPAAPVYDHYYAPAHSYRHNEQVPTTTTTTQYSLHRNPDGREEEEGGGGWNAATTQLQQQQQQQSRHNVTRTE